MMDKLDNGGDMLSREEQDCLVAATGDGAEDDEQGTIEVENRLLVELVGLMECATCGTPWRPSCDCPGLDGDHPQMDGSAPYDPSNFPATDGSMLEAKLAASEICRKSEIAWRRRLQEYVGTRAEVMCTHDPRGLDCWNGQIVCIECEEER